MSRRRKGGLLALDVYTFEVPERVVEEADVETIKAIVKAYYGLEKQRIATGHRIRARGFDPDEAVKQVIREEVGKVRLEIPTEMMPAVAVYALLRESEKAVRKILQAYVERRCEWKRWLSRVKGIGPILAAGLISIFNPLKAEHGSAYYRFAGLHVITRCKKCGKRVFENPKEWERWVANMVQKLKTWRRHKGLSPEKLWRKGEKEAKKWRCACK